MLLIDLIALSEKSCSIELMFSGDWYTCQSFNLLIKVRYCFMRVLQYCRTPWETDNSAGQRTIYSSLSQISAMSWLNIYSSNTTIGKSLGIPMGLRCKQGWDTPQTNLRDHKAYQIQTNLGYGYECSFCTYTVWFKHNYFGMILLLMSC